MVRRFIQSGWMICGTIGLMWMAVPRPAVGESYYDEMIEQAQQWPEKATSETTAKTQMEKAHSEPAVQTQPRYQRVDHLIGRSIIDVKGEKLGHVEDIVLDGDGHSVSYAVLSYGGVFGIGNKFFAVPWSEFQTCPKTGAFVLDVRKEYLEAARGFDKGHWPKTAAEGWAERIRTAYQEGQRGLAEGRHVSSPMKQTMAEASLPIRCRRVTRLIGMPAKDLQGRRLGNLKDLVIDTDNDGVAYGVVMLPTTFPAFEREMAIVPWTTVEVVPELHALRLDADESMLESVAFARGDFPDLGNPLYVQRIERQFEGTPYWETLGYIPGDRMSSATGMTRTEAGAPEALNISAWKSDSKYNRRFDPGLLKTVRGTVQSIGTFKVGNSSIEGLDLSVKTADGDLWTVHAGPRPYVDSQDILFHFGDEITVTGALTQVGWRTFLMASKIEKDGATLSLRDEKGMPLWSVEDLLGSGPSM